MKLATVLTLCVLLAGSVLAADKLFLKDGQIVTGKILEETKTDIRIATDEETMRIPLWAIEKVERGSGATAARSKAETGAGRTHADAAPSEAMLAWIDLCIQHLGSGDRAVRGSASSALRTAGAAAKPALEKAAVGDNELVAQRARVLLGRTATPTVAEDGVGPLALTLGLTNDQKPQVAAIFEELRAKQREAIANANKGETDGDALKEQLAALRADSETKLSAVLTDDQMTRYREMRRGR